ncbi:MAG: purQ [Ilumatobacteraceae bacterium]|nr:purQ [Ilumatobacteraceae bacterium]
MSTSASRPTALILRAPGTNRDGDAAFALDLVGADPRRALLSEVFADPKLLHEAQLLVVPGGFSFADALGAGRLFALELVTRLRDELAAFVEAGKPVIGICNGFQVLVRTGLLPGDGLTVALGGNRVDGAPEGQFVCDWVRLQPVSQKCIWTTDLTADVECPIAHGEGRFVCDPDTMATLTNDDQIAFRYATPNPNGSMADVAGICDATGLVLGLMPHPENHVLPRQHPQYLRHHRGGLGRALFEAGVNHAKEL